MDGGGGGKGIPAIIGGMKKFGGPPIDGKEGGTAVGKVKEGGAEPALVGLLVVGVSDGCGGGCGCGCGS